MNILKINQVMASLNQSPKSESEKFGSNIKKSLEVGSVQDEIAR